MIFQSEIASSPLNFQDIYELLFVNPLNQCNTLQKIYQMKSNNCLSLQKWSYSYPYKSNDCRKLSPLTSKILCLTKTNAHELMHISFEQFSLALKIPLKDNNKMYELYQQQMTYRKKKLELLKSIWKKSHKQIIASSSLASSTSSTVLTSRFLNRSKKLRKTNSKASIQKCNKQIKGKDTSIKENKKKSVSPFWSIKDKKKSSQYQYFENFSRKSKELSNADESTKSNKQIYKYMKNAKKSVSPNEDYYENSLNNNSKRQTKLSDQLIKISQNQKEDLSRKVYNLLERFSNIFDKQARQLEESKDLSSIEKKRLNKLHKFEQIQLKEEIDRLKKNL